MKLPLLSIIIPVFNEAKNLPALFRALEKQTAKNFEVIFVDNISTDSSPLLLQEWKRKAPFSIPVSIEKEKQRGFAPPLVRGIRVAKAPSLVTLDADCLPHSAWTKKMAAALTEHNIVVGETTSLLSAKPTPSELLAQSLFHRYSERTARGEDHALPWGPTCNLGVRKKLFRSIGPLSAAAGSAFDMDWCWRAVLQGEKIHFEADAKVFHKRRKDHEKFLRQIYRYGSGEAWIQKQYAFLQDKEDQAKLTDPSYPLHSALSGAERFLQNLPKIFQKAGSLGQKASIAFACGILEGHLKPSQKQAIREKPKIPYYGIELAQTDRSVKVLVPGKGVLTLTGAGKVLWDAIKTGRDLHGLIKLLHSQYGLDSHEARHEATHFLDAIRSEQREDRQKR